MIVHRLTYDTVTVAYMLLPPVVGIVLGVALGYVIGGFETGWRPDVGGVMLISILGMVLGTAGFTAGVYGAFRIYWRRSEDFT
jgi:hypothetical protein